MENKNRGRAGGHFMMSPTLLLITTLHLEYYKWSHLFPWYEDKAEKSKRVLTMTQVLQQVMEQGFTLHHLLRTSQARVVRYLQDYMSPQEQEMLAKIFFLPLSSVWASCFDLLRLCKPLRTRTSNVSLDASMMPLGVCTKKAHNWINIDNEKWFYKSWQ